MDTAVLMLGMSDVGMGGGDVHALRLCNALAREGKDRVELISSPAVWSKLPPAVRPTVFEVRTPLDGRLRSMPAYLITVVLRMIWVLRRMPQARVYVAASHFFYDVIPCALAKGACVSYVYHLIGESGRSPSLRSRVSIALERLSLIVLRRYGDLIFVDNPETEAQLLVRGFRPEQISTTRNAYDPLMPLPARAATNGSIVFCGRISEAKGVWDIVPLARALRERVPDAHITVIGEGALRPEVEEALRAETLTNVRFTGFVSEEQKWSHIRNATLFVAPSREEGWGIAVGEALLAGVPALVYDLPAYGHFGDLPVRVPIGDVHAFVETAAGLLADLGRLDQERLRTEAGSDRLPRWHDVINDEISAMRDPDPFTPRMRERATQTTYRSSSIKRPALGTVIAPGRRNASTARRITSAMLDACTLPLIALSPRGKVDLLGRTVALEYDFRRWMWRSERCLELALARLALTAHPPTEVLEIGNVMPLAGYTDHMVVDKYEPGTGVVNEDILTFDPGRRFGLVLSISTLEHVGWDEEPQQPDKAAAALSRLSDLVESEGALLVTIPVDYHRSFEQSFVAADGPFDEVSLFVKTSRMARWEKRPLAELRGVRYGSPFSGGNGVLVGTRGMPFGGR